METVYSLASSHSLSLLSAAVFNLSAPRVVYEQNRTFSANVSLIAPEGGTTINIEIDIMEIGVTATPFGESQETMNNKIIMSIFKLHNKNSLIISNGNLICIKFLFSADLNNSQSPGLRTTVQPTHCSHFLIISKCSSIIINVALSKSDNTCSDNYMTCGVCSTASVLELIRPSCVSEWVDT